MPKLSTFESFMIASVLSFAVAALFTGLLYLAKTYPYILVNTLSVLSDLTGIVCLLITLSWFVWIVYKGIQRFVAWIRN